MDFEAWHIVLNMLDKSQSLPDDAMNAIFKPDFSKQDWLAYAKKESEQVQYVVPWLDLRTSELTTVRNKKTKAGLERRGFNHVIVNQLSTNPWKLKRSERW